MTWSVQTGLNLREISRLIVTYCDAKQGYYLAAASLADDAAAHYCRAITSAQPDHAAAPKLSALAVSDK